MYGQPRNCSDAHSPFWLAFVFAPEKRRTFLKPLEVGGIHWEMGILGMS